MNNQKDELINALAESTVWIANYAEFAKPPHSQELKKRLRLNTELLKKHGVDTEELLNM